MDSERKRENNKPILRSHTLQQGKTRKFGYISGQHVARKKFQSSKSGNLMEIPEELPGMIGDENGLSTFLRGSSGYIAKKGETILSVPTQSNSQILRRANSGQSNFSEDEGFVFSDEEDVYDHQLPIMEESKHHNISPKSRTYPFEQEGGKYLQRSETVITQQNDPIIAENKLLAKILAIKLMTNKQNVIEQLNENNTMDNKIIIEIEEIFLGQDDLESEHIKNLERYNRQYFRKSGIDRDQKMKSRISEVFSLRSPKFFEIEDDDRNNNNNNNNNNKRLT